MKALINNVMESIKIFHLIFFINFMAYESGHLLLIILKIYTYQIITLA